MIDLTSRLMLFMRDFTGRGADSFFWFQDGQLQETDAVSVVGFAGIVVCHDFWLIRDALFDKTGTLPGTIIDVDELRISISGVPEDRLAREKRDVTRQLGRYGAGQEVCDTYQKMFNKGVAFDGDIAAKAAAIIERGVTSGRLSEARINDSYERVLALKPRAGIVS